MLTISRLETSVEPFQQWEVPIGRLLLALLDRFELFRTPLIVQHHLSCAVFR